MQCLKVDSRGVCSMIRLGVSGKRMRRLNMELIDVCGACSTIRLGVSGKRTRCLNGELKDACVMI
jgi:hypothetical protein